LKTGKAAGQLKGHSGVVVSLAFSADGKLLLSSAGELMPRDSDPITYDNTIRLWDVDKQRELRTLLKADAAYGLGAAPDGRWAIATTQRWGVAGFRFDLAAGKDVHNLGGYACAAFSPDGKLLALAPRAESLRYQTGQITLLDTATWNPVGQTAVHVG